MTRYVGLDVHKHFIEVCILDRSGKAVFRGRAECRREELERFAKEKLKRSDRVALEATTNTWPVVDILRPFVPSCWRKLNAERGQCAVSYSQPMC